MERIKLFTIAAIVCIGLPGFSDEPPRVIPAVKAVNLAPMDTGKQEVKAVNLLKPDTAPQNIPANVVPVKVQTIPAQGKEEPVKVQAVPVKQEEQAEKTPQNNSAASYQPPVQLVSPNGQGTNPLTTPADIESDACVKIFQMNAEDLFIYTLAALEANNFSIGEIQSHGGYITFKAANKNFLAIVSEVDSKNSMLKITPSNGVYHFAPGIVYKVFEYITLKMK